MNLSKLSVSDLLEAYASAAAAHGRASLSGNHPVANRRYDEIADLRNEIFARGAAARQEFLTLLRHADAFVRAWAGAHSLEIDPKRAVSTLEELSRGRGLPAHSAGLTLREWRGGSLRFDGGPAGSQGGLIPENPSAPLGQRRSPAASGSILWPAVTAFPITFVLTALLRFGDSWIGSLPGAVVFLVHGWAVGRWVGRRAWVALALGLGLTWGPIGVAALIGAARHSESPLPGLAVLGLVVVDVIAGYVSGRRKDHGWIERGLARRAG